MLPMFVRTRPLRPTPDWSKAKWTACERERKVNLFRRTNARWPRALAAVIEGEGAPRSSHIRENIRTIGGEF